jgi:hypothetical protein
MLKNLVEAFEAIIGVLEGGLVGASAVAPTPVGAALIAQLRNLLMTDNPTGFLSKEHRIIDNVKAGTWKTDHPDE